MKPPDYALNHEHTDKVPLYLSITGYLFALSVFLLALTRIQDPDAWMHLSLGRLIWELKHLPAKELFTYPYADMPFYYTSWLFAVVCYLIFVAFTAAGLIFFKAAVIALSFWIMMKDALRPYRNYAVAAIVLSAEVFVLQFRFVLRPEIFLMVFLPFSIFSLNAFIHENKKYIYFLPLVHIVWANSHSSIVLMSVPFIAFLTGGALNNFLNRKGPSTHQEVSIRQLKIIGLVFLFSVAASFLSPNSINQFLYGPQVLSGDWNTRVMVELHPPTGSGRLLLYAMVSIIISSFILNAKRISLIDLLLVIPFLYMPFVADRFITLIVITTGPIVARNISGFLASLKLNGFFIRKAGFYAAVIWIVLYCSLAFARIGPPILRGGDFGLGFDYSLVPHGAVAYMDRKGIYGRVMNELSDGQYVIWTGYPRRTVFIDGRGYLSDELLEKSTTFRFSRQVLDDLYATYGFEAVLLHYPLDPIYAGMHDYWFSNPEWALVYWDDTSLLYLKRGSKYDAFIKQDEYQYIKPDMSLYYFVNDVESKKDGDYRENLVRDLLRNINETDSSLAYSFLGILYSKMGRYREAAENLERVRDFKHDNHLYIVSVLAAQAYRELGELEKSLICYNRVLKMNEDSTALSKTAEVYLALGRNNEAVKLLTRALKLNRNEVDAYPLLITAYEKMGLTKEASQTRNDFQGLTGPKNK